MDGKTWKAGQVNMRHIDDLIGPTLSGRHCLDLDLGEARRRLGRVHVVGSPSSNAKLAKSGGAGWQSVGLSLAPSTQSGLGVTTCGQEGTCARYCVAGSGNAIAFSNVSEARNALTRKLVDDPIAFVRVLVQDVIDAAFKARAEGDRLVLRLNVFSDIAWERISPSLFEVMAHHSVPAYDYTKRLDRFERDRPANYTLIASHSERNEIGSSAFALHDFVQRGINVAIPFDVVRGHPLPAMHHGIRVVDGDATDLRHLDPAGVIVGLRSKITKNGKANESSSRGFVLTVLREFT